MKGPVRSSSWRTRRRPFFHYGRSRLWRLQIVFVCVVHRQHHTHPWALEFYQHNHSQCIRRALLNLSRSRIPRTPNSIGLVTKGHPTLHLPPEISLSPAQRTCCQILSRFFSSCFGTLREVSKETGSTPKTERTNSLLPAWFKSRPCQPALCLFPHALYMRNFKGNCSGAPSSKKWYVSQSR